MADLSDEDRSLLHFEREWWSKPGAKAASIRARFDLTETAYYQRLNRLIDNPAAVEADPLVVNRLRRLRDRGAERRSAFRRA